MVTITYNSYTLPNPYGKFSFRENEKTFNFSCSFFVTADTEENLVALSFTIGKDLVDTPGVLFQIARSFAWENINIIEIISIDSEITFIVEEKDAIRGYKALQKLIIQ